MRNKKLLSFILAMVMMVTAFIPILANAQQPTPVPTATDVIIHKIKMDTISNHWPNTTGIDGTKYDGTQIGDIGKFFGAGAVPLNGVTFTYYKVDDAAKFKAMKDAPANFKTKEQVEAHLGAGVTGTTTAATAGEGVVSLKALANGNYWFVENPGSALADGATLSGAAAVPFGITLPLVKADGKYFGVGDDALHLYPKNTIAEKPIVDKDFEGHANPTNPANPKQTKSFNIGDLVPYEVKTIIPANATYKTAYWSDVMTEGLTFNPDSVKVTIGGADAVAGTDYKVTAGTNPDRFKLELLQAGLDKINNKANPVEIVIKYNATLNENAVVDVPESNDVTFHYGNNPSNGNTPIPTKPENGEIVAKKSWAGGNPPAGVEATIQLIDANTGKQVGANAKLNAANNWTFTFKAPDYVLDKDKEYKVVELDIAGYTPEYGVESNGVITIKNHKTDNPPPINPEEPKVITYGKKFVKTDDKDLSAGAVFLPGAEFVVLNTAKDKYLALKDTATQAADLAAYKDAEAKYQEAISKLNKFKADNPTGDASALEAAVVAAKTARDAAYEKLNMEWTWVDDINKAFKLVSDQNGKFEIKGLKEGTYFLKETKAPEGYALLTGETEFKVGPGTYSAGEQQIKNKKVTIPETGGIGSAIFVVAGLALMGASAVAYKKRMSKVD